MRLTYFLQWSRFCLALNRSLFFDCAMVVYVFFTVKIRNIYFMAIWMRMPPHAVISESLVPSWCNCLGSIRRCDLTRREAVQTRPWLKLWREPGKESQRPKRWPGLVRGQLLIICWKWPNRWPSFDLKDTRYDRCSCCSNFSLTSKPIETLPSKACQGSAPQTAFISFALPERLVGSSFALWAPFHYLLDMFQTCSGSLCLVLLILFSVATWLPLFLSPFGRTQGWVLAAVSLCLQSHLMLCPSQEESRAHLHARKQQVVASLNPRSLF